MSITTYTPGQRVYSVEGAAGLFVAKVDEGFVVQPLYGGDEADDEAYPEGAALWRTAHATAPVERFDAAIAAMNTKLDNLRAEVRELETKKHDLNRMTAEQRERLAQHEALRPLDDLLSGRVTHFVTTRDDNFRVYTPAQAKAMDAEWLAHSQTRLTLVSSHNAPSGLTWRMSQEHRGRDHSVLLFTNEADAVAKCCELIAAKLEQLADANYFNEWSAREPLKAAAFYGVPTPAKLAERIRAFEVATATAARDKAAKELADAEAKLAVPRDAGAAA